MCRPGCSFLSSSLFLSSTVAHFHLDSRPSRIKTALPSLLCSQVRPWNQSWQWNGNRITKFNLQIESYSGGGVPVFDLASFLSCELEPSEGDAARWGWWSNSQNEPCMVPAPTTYFSTGERNKPFYLTYYLEAEGKWWFSVTHSKLVLMATAYCFYSTFFFLMLQKVKLLL